MDRREMLKGLGICAAAGAVCIIAGPKIALANELFVYTPKFQFPETELNNGLIRAKIYLPDQANGYYRSTRFDWSGVISGLEYKGHSYFGEWFEKHNPLVNDAITGPVEEFNPMGYEEAKPGDTFLKIGVGVLRKSDDGPYHFSKPFDVVDYGKWSSVIKKDQVEFDHELKDATGYSYRYQKKVQLIKGKPELVLGHTLKNTGERKIETKVYNHNFFRIDNQKIGPAYVVEFPFSLALIRNSRGLGTLVEVRKNKIEFLRALEKGESAQLFFEGYSQRPEDYDIRIDNSMTGAGVRITGDHPVSDLAFWCMENTLCPEPYIKVDVDPGKEMKWEIKYGFYSKK